MAEERAAERVFMGFVPRSHADSLSHARVLLRAITAGLERRAPVDSARIARSRQAAEMFARLPDARPRERVLALREFGRTVNVRGGALDLGPLHEALEILDSGAVVDDTLAADIHYIMCSLLRDEDRSETALAHSQRAYELLVGHHGEHHPASAAMLVEHAVTLDRAGRHDEAMAALHAARAVFDDPALQLHPDRRMALVYASGFTKQDELGERLALRHEALRIAEANHGEGSREAQTDLINLGVALMDFGDFAGARQLMTRGLPSIERSFGPRHAVTNAVRQQLAIACFQVGDSATARRLLLESERVVRETGRGSLGTTLRWQAELMQREGRAAEASLLASRAYAADSARRDGPTWPLGRSLMVRLQALESLGDTSAMRVDLFRLLALADSDEHWREATAAAICEWRSRTARRCGETTEAWRWAIEAARLSREQTRLLIRSLPDSRALQLARQGTRYLQLLASQADPPEHWEGMWDALVRERGGVRSEMTRRRLPSTWRGDTALVIRHTRWSAAQRALAAFLVEQSPTTLDSSDAARLTQLRREVEVAEASLALRGATAPRDTLDTDLAAVRAALRDGEALVGMHLRWGGTDSAQVIAIIARAQERSLQRVVLGSADSLALTIDAWRERLASPPGTSPATVRRAESAGRAAGARVRSTVWEPLAAKLSGVRVVHVVEEGPFVDLPWSALPMGTKDYLIDVGPEIRVLEAERELLRVSGPPAAASTLLAIGAPDYGRTLTAAAQPIREGADLCAGDRPAFGALPGTAGEVTEIAAQWRPAAPGAVIVRVGAAASESAFRADAPGRSVVHLATHGFVAGDVCRGGASGLRGLGGVGRVADRTSRTRASRSVSPRTVATPWMDRRVWLALAGANDRSLTRTRGDDGLLTAEEVVTLDLAGTDWVVLSACHSAYSSGWSRDGALGMRRAFRLAGARSVIASHWAIADEAAREWMRALYAARAEGHTDAADAVRQASRRVLAARRANGRATHPFHWAAFSASGR